MSVHIPERMPVHISKPFLPPFDEYAEAIRPLWESHQLTNNGFFVQQLEKELCAFLGLEECVFCTNGTIALQMAIEALEVKGEIITSPFSYIATLDSILWQKCTPVFADIDPDSLCISPAAIQSKIRPKTAAILATHVFGRACDISAIEEIASAQNIKVIFDGAHSFAVSRKGRSLLDHGDISICSFNATKIFHTVEGGALITRDKAMADKLRAMRYFGFRKGQVTLAGLNAKQSEFHAAMGLVNLRHFEDIRNKYQSYFQLYHSLLKETSLKLPELDADTSFNYAYFPVLFKTEEDLLKVLYLLNAQQIFPRRYFFPTLNTLSIINGASCPVAERLARKIMCLPLCYDLSGSTVRTICSIIKETV